MPDILTVQQAAQYLQVNPETVRKAARSGRLRASRVGRRWRIRQKDLNEWVEQDDSWYERMVDKGLAEAVAEAKADPANRETIPWEEVKAKLGL